ncbi:chromosome-associated kinesin KIF4 [Bacillus rossius redtenbacheri]|uniref:chromosome-associated kinesin KIF4 n=1 Tax=Bacillus rossius redtenbacheri TaxID=93214 RepID=UPI002FDD5150
MVENLETIQVALRIRPLVDSEVGKGCQVCLESVAQCQVLVKNVDKAFTFNYVFGPDDSQDLFYNTAVKHMVSRLFKGYNVTVLAYGQTGSGKTFSIGTSYIGEGEKGVIPRAIDDIFEQVAKMSDWEFKITVSFVELYKEQLYDLLATTRCSIDIREDAKGIRMPGLTEMVIGTPEEMLDCLAKGSSGRATGATAMNAQSSRSHAIFTIHIQMTKLGDMNNVLNAKFHLVDLAGSERPKKTKAVGDRFQEGININRGLLALGNVISALGEGNHNYIGYRDSKLTRLLQDSLGGNSLTLMIACVSPADYNLQETLSTLRYADRARQIKNKPIVNQDPHTAEILCLKKQIQELRMQVVQGDGQSCPPEHHRLEEENLMLLSKIRNFTEQLNELLNQNVHLVERAHLAEQARARMQLKMTELQADYDLTLGGLNQSVENMKNCPAEFAEQLRKLSVVQQKIKDMQEEQQRDSEELLNHELSACGRASGGGPEGEGSEEGDIEEKRGAHVVQQTRLNQELQELTRALALKEELASKLAANAGQMATVREEYALNQEAVEALKREKEHLQHELSRAQAANSSKSAEHWRKQIQELEHKINALNKKICDQAKVIKMKERSDEKINTLQSEIHAMKSAKVRLIRQMKAEGDRFKSWKLERERELIKLKDQDRKRQNQIVRMERLHAKQQNVLKRKFEESVAINKRLKDALALQRTVQERRHAKGDATSRVQAWVSQELEVLVSTVAAEHTLLELIEDRGVLTAQLNQVRAQLEQLDGGDLSPEEAAALREDRRQLEEDLELRSAQVADLQQKIADSDQENKGKTRWESLQSMAEAKCALAHLFELAAEVKKELSFKARRLSELEDALRAARDDAEGCRENARQLAARHKEDIDQLEKEHQNKVFMLLNQLRGVQPEGGDKMLRDRIRILEQSFEQLEVLQRRLEESEAELASVRGLLDQRTAELEEERERKHHRSKQEKKKENVEILPPHRSLIESDDDFIDDSFADPDWRKTPLFQKIQRLKRPSVLNTDRGAKRTADGQTKCSCRGKGRCLKKNCSCRKMGASCGQHCRCVDCLNKDENEDREIISKLNFADETSYDDEDLSSVDSKRSRTLSSIENTMDHTSKMREQVRYFPEPEESSKVATSS